MTARLGHETLASRRKKARGGGLQPIHESDPTWKGPCHPCTTTKCGHAAFWHLNEDGKTAGCNYPNRQPDGKVLFDCPCARFQRA